jgi:hypothetical protein
MWTRFYGPAEWKTQADKEKKSRDALSTEAAELSATLTKTPDAATSSDNETARGVAVIQLRAPIEIETKERSARRCVSRGGAYLILGAPPLTIEFRPN